MDLDGRSIPAGIRLEADLCVIGAGPAGMVVAGALAGRGLDVVVLESGGEVSEPAAQELNEGTLSGEEAYAGLRATRHRQVGGTSSLWNTPVVREIGGEAERGSDTRGGADREVSTTGEVGAKYVPLDPIDFERGDPGTRWPLGAAELDPFYREAQRVCGLGPFAYDAESWIGSAPAPPVPAGGDLVSRVYQLGTRRSFPGRIRTRLQQAASVRLVHHATVLRLDADGSRRRVRCAEVASPAGNRWEVWADRFVLAGGAVENARLLLVSGPGPEGLGNRHGWVGRCFMEHPRDRTLALIPRSRADYERASFYDTWSAADGTRLLGRLALSEEAIRDRGLPNASVTLLPRLTRAARGLRSVLEPLTRLPAIERRLPGPGHGWSRQLRPEKVFDGFTALLNLEMAPHPENRIVLGRRGDAFGIPLPALQLRWRNEDADRAEKLRRVVAHGLGEIGIGRVEIEAPGHPDLNAHHHAGTTRMSDDPRHGVVDPDGRVHDVENLYVAGASLFPTAGFANPLLTIVALALRLAEHLGGGSSGTGGTP